MDCNIKESFYKAFSINKEPVEVTDDRVLRIFAAICWSYNCTQNDFYLYDNIVSKDDLIDAILEHATELSKNDDYIYTKVREIFEQPEEDDFEL